MFCSSWFIFILRYCLFICVPCWELYWMDLALKVFEHKIKLSDLNQLHYLVTQIRIESYRIYTIAYIWHGELWLFILMCVTFFFRPTLCVCVCTLRVRVFYRHFGVYSENKSLKKNGKIRCCVKALRPEMVLLFTHWCLNVNGIM